jgi:hypothetical protein
MPGLQPTCAQACRLWQLDTSTCEVLLEQLVQEGFLFRTDKGAYIALSIRGCVYPRGLRRALHGSVKPIHHEELEDGEKERPSAFPKIMLKQTDSGIQQLHGAATAPRISNAGVACL